MSDEREAVAQAAKRLAAAGIESARADARILTQHAGGDAARFESLIARRLQREPVAYITGHKEFWSLDFEVGPGVLIPRPETETLVEEALREFPDRDAPLRMLDLGAGSGCILIAALHEFPRSRGIGIESSPRALAYAERNAARLLSDGRCEMRLGDWRGGVAGSFDIIFANPPYVADAAFAQLAPELRRYEPEAALRAGSDGLDAYRMIAPVIAPALQGCAFVELGLGAAESVGRIFEGAGLKVARIVPDLAGIPRCLVARRAA